jgi:hypothetical protein
VHAEVFGASRGWDELQPREAELSTRQHDDALPGLRQPDDTRPRRDNDVWMKTYRYLRIAMALLLIALATSVFYQSARQGSLLASVSAYYYTPARSIVVSGLIGLGACMIALKGTTPVEDTFLNLGGMFAVVVAIVPTSRGRDYEDLVSSCGALQEQTSAAPDCADVRALAESARADIENNVFAVLVVGSLALAAAVVFMVLDQRREEGHRFSWLAFSVAVAVLVAGWVAFYGYRTEFVRNAHWVAGLSLFGCIFVVAFENARRQQGMRTATGTSTPKAAQAPGDKIRTPRQINARSVLRRARDFYTLIATALLVIGVISVVAWWRNWITLFWLEIIVFFLFSAFWVAQTVEQDGRPPATEPIMTAKPSGGGIR